MVLLTVIFLLGCNSSKYSEIYFQNKSGLFVDSAKIHIQNYVVAFYSIKPHSAVQKKVFKDSVASNNHDITIQATIYDTNKTNFTGGFYYTDLSGYLENEYKITLTDNLNITIR